LLRQQNQAAALAASVSADISGPENLAAALAASEVSADNLDLKNSDPSVVLSASVSNDGLESNVLGGNMKVFSASPSPSSASASAENLQLVAPAEPTLDNQFLKVMESIHQFQVKLAPKINTFESRRAKLLEVFQSRTDQREEIEKLKRIRIYLESLEKGKISDVKQEDKSFFAIELKGCCKSCVGELEADTVSDDERIKKYSNLLKGLFSQAKQSASQDHERLSHSSLVTSRSTLFSKQPAHQAPPLFPKDMLVLNQERLDAEIEWAGPPENEVSKQKLKKIINQYKSFWPGPSSLFAEAALKTSLQTASLVNLYDGVKAFLDQNPNKAADYADFAVTRNKFGQVSALASKAALTKESAKAMLEEFLAFNYEGPVYVAASSQNDFDLAIEAAKALSSDTSLKVIVSFGGKKGEIDFKAAQTLSHP
jgi:hypothetical protein